jgi:flagellar hook-basal body complex protein FliE
MERIQFQPAQSSLQPSSKPEKETPAEAQKQFADMLGAMMNNVNDTQVKSDVATQQLINGEATNLHNVMIAAEKASVTLSTAVEVRNKAVEAYKTIMRMQI